MGVQGVQPGAPNPRLHGVQGVQFHPAGPPATGSRLPVCKVCNSDPAPHRSDGLTYPIRTM